VTDFLDVKQQEITSRLKELRPLIEEYHRLEAAASALDGLGLPAAAPAAAAAPKAARKAAAKVPGRRGPGRPRGSKTKVKRAAAATTAAPAPARGGARRKAGRRKGSGTRAAEAMALVQGQPGITIPELAAKMGIKQNYLYRVLPGLESENKVAKRGRGWHPKG
jgi:hypothetical protein